MDDIERLKELVSKLKKNDENVPEEELRGKYRKPYDELRGQIRMLATRVANKSLREGWRLLNDDEGMEILHRMGAIVEEQKRTGEPRELGRCLFREYDVEGFLARVQESRQRMMEVYKLYYEKNKEVLGRDNE